MAGSSSRVLAISCGASHSVALLTGSLVCSWGRSEDGQLGHGDSQERHVPFTVDALQGTEVSQVVCGADHTLAYSSSKRTVYSWGWGDFGRLGHGNSNDSSVPMSIQSLKGLSIKQIACGDCHCLAITDEGEVYSWGRNQNGQLGLGSTVDGFLPQKVAAFEGLKVRMVAAGAEHTAAITEDGRMYGWGWNHYGNLGLGDRSDRRLPELVTSVQGEKMVMVACGWRHTVALTDTGKVYTVGWSKYGQLGHGDHADHLVPRQVEALKDVTVSQIAGGWRHSVAVSSDGALFSWGWNKFGQLGIGNNEDKKTPQEVTFIKEAVSRVSCGWRHTVAVTERGNVYSWGRGTTGKLGHGDTLDRNTPKLLELLSVDGRACVGIPNSSFGLARMAMSGQCEPSDEPARRSDQRPSPLNLQHCAVSGPSSLPAAAASDEAGVHGRGSFKGRSQPDWLPNRAVEPVPEPRIPEPASSGASPRPSLRGVAPEGRGRNGAELEARFQGAAEGSPRESLLHGTGLPGRGTGEGEGLGPTRMEPMLLPAKALVEEGYKEGYSFDGGGRQPDGNPGPRFAGAAVGLRSDAGAGSLSGWGLRPSSFGLANVGDGGRKGSGGAAIQMPMPMPVSVHRGGVGGGRGRGREGGSGESRGGKKENVRGKRKCPECTSMIAAAAADCSHCGHMFRPSKWNKQRASMLSLGNYPRLTAEGTPPAASQEESVGTAVPGAEPKPNQVNDMLATVVQVAGWRKQMDGTWMNRCPTPPRAQPEVQLNMAGSRGPPGPLTFPVSVRPPAPSIPNPSLPSAERREWLTENASETDRKGNDPRGGETITRPREWLTENASETDRKGNDPRGETIRKGNDPRGETITRPREWLTENESEADRIGNSREESIARPHAVSGKVSMLPSLELQLLVSPSDGSAGARGRDRHYVVPDEQSLEFEPDSQVEAARQVGHTPLLSLNLFPTESESTNHHKQAWRS